MSKCIANFLKTTKKKVAKITKDEFLSLKLSMADYLSMQSLDLDQ